MRHMAMALALTLAVGLFACSGGGETGGVGVLDTAATNACQTLTQVMQQYADGGLSVDQLRAGLSSVYNEASSSANAIIRARAVALYADATVIASGGDAGSLQADLSSMQRTCAGGTGS